MNEQLKKYDLINELGSKNKYDQVAAKAQIIGEKLNDFVLSSGGTKLGKLIKEIPYNSDKFYLVIDQEKRVRKMIESAEKRKYGLLNSETWTNYSVWECNDKTWSAMIGFHRKDKEDKVDIPQEVKKILLGKKYSYNVESIGGGSKDYYEEYESDNPDDLFIKIKRREHENQSDYGLSIEIYGFKTEEAAKSFFKFATKE